MVISIVISIVISMLLALAKIAAAFKRDLQMITSGNSMSVAGLCN